MRKHRLRVAVNRHLLGSGDEWLELDQRQDACFGTESILQRLKSCAIFAGCDGDTLSELAGSASVLSLNPPGCFYNPGEASDGLYLVLEGNVALYERINGEEGHEVKVESCPPGELFGLQSFVDGTARKYLAQAEQYSVVAHLTEAAMRRLISDHPRVEIRLNESLEARSRQREKDARVAHKELMAALHARDRLKLSEELRQNVSEYLQRPALHHIVSLLSSRVRHEDILRATMAGAAIIAACRGEVDEAEERFLRHTMAEADLLRHLDLKHGLELFRKYASFDDVLSGEGHVFAMLDRTGEMKGGRQIVHAIAVGMTGVHGTPTDKERDMLTMISDRLGVEPPHWARAKQEQPHE
jgi:CRP-like cAMP-binding protein